MLPYWRQPEALDSIFVRRYNIIRGLIRSSIGLEKDQKARVTFLRSFDYFPLPP